MGCVEAGITLLRVRNPVPPKIARKLLVSSARAFLCWPADGFLKSCSIYADGLDRRHGLTLVAVQRRNTVGEPMSITPISAAGLSQDVLLSSNSPQQQALQTLQISLSSGDLNAAQSAFQTLQALFQNSEISTGSTSVSNSQLATDLSALGSALSSGDLSTAQSAFTTVQGDLSNSASTAEVSEDTAAAQSLQLVEGILSTLNPSTVSSSSIDNTTSILQSVYASQSGLDVLA
jgi:hypothetical protein